MLRSPVRKKKGRKRKTTGQRRPPSLFSGGSLLFITVVVVAAIFGPGILRDRPFWDVLKITKNVSRGRSSSSGQPLGIKPRLLIVNENGRHVDRLHFRLSPALRATNSVDVGTVVRLVKRMKMVDAYYSQNEFDVKKMKAEVLVWSLEFLDLKQRKVLFVRDFMGASPEDEALTFLERVRRLEPGSGSRSALRIGPIWCKPTLRDSLSGRAVERVRPGNLARVYALPATTAEELTQRIIRWSVELKTRLRATQVQPNGFHALLCDRVNQFVEGSVGATLAVNKGGDLMLDFEKAPGRNYSIMAYALLPLEPGPSLVVWKTPFSGESVPTLDDATVVFRSFEQLSVVAPVWSAIAPPDPAFNFNAGLPASLAVNVLCLKSQAASPTNRDMASPDDAMVCIMSEYQAQLLYQEISLLSIGLQSKLGATPESPNGFHLELAKRINRYARTTAGISVSPGREKGRHQLTFTHNRRENYVVMSFAYMLFEEGAGMLVWEKPYTGAARMTLHQGDVKQNSMDLLKPQGR